MQRFVDVEIKILHPADGRPDFTGTEIAVMINDNGGFPGGTGHSPRRWTEIIGILQFVDKSDKSQEIGLGDFSFHAVKIFKQPVGLFLEKGIYFFP